MRLASLALISILIMTLDHRDNHLQAVRSTLSVLIYPIQQLANLPQSGGKWIAEGLSTRQELQEENASLRTQVFLQQTQLQQLIGLKAENMRLRELLDSARRINERVLIAEIMSVDLEPFSHQIVINKGSRSGVYIGQPIIDADGVMGQIISISPFTSIAMIITDPSHAIPVVVNRNGLRAIAIGTGIANTMDIPHIPNNADIQVGDILVTSGLGGRFPAGYPVATITETTTDPSRPFASISATSTAKLDRSREALLVWRNDVQANETAEALQMDCTPEDTDCEQTPESPQGMEP